MINSNFLDLRGVECPLNYVKVKVLIEEIPMGETIEVLLDEGNPVLNVTQSLLNDGQTILSCTHSDNHYVVKIRKDREY